MMSQMDQMAAFTDCCVTCCLPLFLTAAGPIFPFRGTILRVSVEGRAQQRRGELIDGSEFVAAAADEDVRSLVRALTPQLRASVPT